MKTKRFKSLTQVLLIMSAGIMCIFSAHGQTIRIADNNENRPAGANVYSTLQAAIDAAQPDDIVYITPSVTPYGDATLSKRITLRGVGFNAATGDRTSTLNTLSLVSSADGVNSVSSAVLKEFNANSITFTNTGIGSPSFDNIVIDKVYVTSQMGSNNQINKAINNLTIRNSHINVMHFNIGAKMANCKIYNNIIVGYIYLSNALAPTLDNNLISNNIFQPGGSSKALTVNAYGITNNTIVINNVFTGSGDAFANLDGVTCNNNIFYGLTPTTSLPANYFRNNSFSNNLVTSVISMPPAGNGGGTNSGLGNLTGVSPAFVSVSSTTWAENFNYNLNAGSPANNAGSDGTDIGLTGGVYPVDENIFFRPAPLPLITELNTSGVIPEDQPLKTSIKAISN